FQAEDGIRDFHVTGVQTCALPICRVPDYGGCAAASCDRACHGKQGWSEQESQVHGFVGTRWPCCGQYDPVFPSDGLRACQEWVKIGRASCRESVMVSERGVYVNGA